MQEKDPIAASYNFGKIASESFSHEVRKGIVDEFSEAFRQTTKTEVKMGQELRAVSDAVVYIEGSLCPSHLTALASPAYDSDVFNHTKIESKIIELKNIPDEEGLKRRGLFAIPGADESHSKDAVYLIVAIAEGQTSIAAFNLSFGALVQEDGSTSYFKLKKYGDLNEDEKPDGIGRVVFGFDDQLVSDKHLVAVKVSEDEAGLIASEFEKATKYLSSHVSDSGISREIRSEMEKLGLNPDNEQHLERAKVRLPQLFTTE